MIDSDKFLINIPMTQSNNIYKYISFISLKYIQNKNHINIILPIL